MRDWPEPDQDTWLEMLDMPEPDEDFLDSPIDEVYVCIDEGPGWDDYRYDQYDEEQEQLGVDEKQEQLGALEYEEHVAVCEWRAQHKIKMHKIEKHKRKIEKDKRKVIQKAEQWMFDLIKCGLEFKHNSYEYEVTFKKAILRFAKELGFEVCSNCGDFEFFCPTCYTCVGCNNNTAAQSADIENLQIHGTCRVDICKDCGDFGLSPYSTPYGGCYICDDYSDILKEVCYNTFHLNPENADIYNNWGVDKSKYGLYKESINNFDTAIKFKPDYALAYFNRGNVKAKTGQYKDAIADYDTAIGLKPDYVLAYHNRGVVKVELGEYDAAIQDYDTAIHHEPYCAEMYHCRGLAKAKLHQYDAAITDYDTAINLEIVSKVDVYINRGNIKAKLGLHKDAISDYDIAIQLTRNNATAYLDRGISKAKLGLHKDAITDYDTAIRFKHDNALAYGYRGLAKAKLHQGSNPDAKAETQQKMGDEYGDVISAMDAVFAAQPETNSQAVEAKQDLFAETEQDLLTALKFAKQAGSADRNHENTLNLLETNIFEKLGNVSTTDDHIDPRNKTSTTPMTAPEDTAEMDV